MSEHEEDIRQEFFVTYLRRNIKYDSTRSSLGRFIYMIVDSIICGYMGKLNEWNKRKEADTEGNAIGFFDSFVEMESKVEIEIFKRLLSRIKNQVSGHRSKCKSKNIYLDAFNMKCGDLFNRDIAKKLGVSDMYVSWIIRVLQDIYRKYSGKDIKTNTWYAGQLQHVLGNMSVQRTSS